MQTSNTEEMVTISRAEYERLQQEKARNAKLEAKLAAREQEQAQVITSLSLQNEWLLEQLKLSKKKLFGRSSEQAFAELAPEERYEKRLEQAKPVLDALLSWANEMQAKTAPKSALGRAIHYLLEQWPYLTRYLEDGRLELSNNRAERSIKPFVMGRKNWLFANTPGGAQASAVIYSLIETAKETKLDPYKYLLWVLQSAPGLRRRGQNSSRPPMRRRSTKYHRNEIVPSRLVSRGGTIIIRL